MPRRLPLLPIPDRTPTVDAVRERLGGRVTAGASTGEHVLLRTPAGAELPGVVLFATGDQVDIWVAQGVVPGTSVVRRARRADIKPLPVPPSRELDAVARDVQAFAALIEGQRIRFQAAGGLAEGTLVEKCRFGALVARDDGTIMGVGFRRLWPAHAGHEAPN